MEDWEEVVTWPVPVPVFPPRPPPLPSPPRRVDAGVMGGVGIEEELAELIDRIESSPNVSPNPPVD